jgi:amidophosphoribosyltransferase
MVQATGLPRENFCLACYNGAYPLPPPKSFGKFCFEGHTF